MTPQTYSCYIITYEITRRDAIGLRENRFLNAVSKHSIKLSSYQRNGEFYSRCEQDRGAGQVGTYTKTTKQYDRS